MSYYFLSPGESVIPARNSSWRRNAILVLVGAFVSPLAVAQDVRLEEVVVTAQRLEETLQDVPISITALSGDQMDDLGFTRSMDIFQYAPGLNMAEQGGANITTINIRGVGGNQIQLGEYPVATFVDDVYVFAGPYLNYGLFDTERVEVLRGPQGTLFGQSTTGGVIHYISRRPTDELDGYIDVSAGTINEHAQDVSLEGAVGGPLSDTVMGRVSAYYADNGDWIVNRIGNDLMEGTLYGIRGQLLFEPNDQLSVLLMASHNEQAVESTYVHVAADLDVATGRESLLPAHVDRWGTGPGLDPWGYRDTDGDLWEIDLDSADQFTDLGFFNVTANIQYEMEGATLTSITGYSDGDHIHFEDVDGGPWRGIDLQYGSFDRWFTEEIRLNGETERTRWQVGGYYMDAEGRPIPTGTDFQLFFPFITIEGNPDDPYVPGSQDLTADGVTNLLQFIGRTTEYTETWAVFGQMDVDLTDRLTATFGLRWTNTEIELDRKDDSIFTDYTTSPPSVFPDPTSYYSLANGDDALLTQDDWNGRFVLSYSANDDLMTYYSLSRGFKGGGFNGGLVPGTFDKIEPEILLAHEFGIKRVFADGNGLLNAAAFIYDYNDYQTFNFIGGSEVVTNEDAESSGFEVELAFSPGEGWNVLAGFSLINAEVKGVRLRGGPIEDTTPSLTPGWSGFGLVQRSWSAMNGTMTAQGDITFTDDYPGDVDNEPVAYGDARTLGNMRLGWSNANDDLTVALNIRNIANNQYHQQAFPFGGGLAQVVPGVPRRINVQVTRQFF